MKLKLEGVFSSVVAIGCVAAAIPNSSVFAAGKSSKENDISGESDKSREEEKKKKEGEEDKKKEEEEKKEKKRKKVRDSMNLASSAMSLRNSRPRSRSMPRARLNGEMDKLIDLQVIDMLQKTVKSLEEKKEKCTLEKMVDGVADTSKFVVNQPVKSTFAIMLLACGGNILGRLYEKGMISDVVVAAFFPDAYKNMKDAKNSKYDLLEKQLSLHEKELALEKAKIDLKYAEDLKKYDIQKVALDRQQQQYVVQDLSLDVGAKQSKADFYKKRPVLSDAKKYVDLFASIAADLCKGIGEFLGLHPGSNGKK